MIVKVLGLPIASLQPSDSKHINGYAVTELVHVFVVNIEQFTTVALQIEDRVQK